MHARSRRRGLAALTALLALCVPSAVAEAEQVRQMVGGEIHRESIALAAGDLLRIVAGQEELDLRLTLRDAEGRVLRSADAPTGQMEPETLSWIAPAAGTYQIEVSSFSEVSTPRAYRITVEPPRPTGPEDREEVAEEESVAAVDAQLNRGTPDVLARALEVYRAALERARRLDRPGRVAALLFRIGRAHQGRNEWSAARDSFAAAVEIHRRHGDTRALAGTLSQIGRTFRALGDDAAALAALTESWTLWKDLGVPGEQANVDVNLGHLHHTRGATEPALAAYREALELYRQEHRTAQEIVVLNNLGGLREQLGEPQAALDLYQQALDLVKPLDRPGLEARIRNNIGVLLMNLGQVHEALEGYSAALPLFRRAGDGRGEAAVLHNLGDLLLDLGAPEQAEPLLRQARELEHATEDRRNEVSSLLLLARAAEDRGSPTDAEPLLAEALALQLQLGDPAGEAAVRLGQAGLLQALGRIDEAREAARRAVELARRSAEAGKEARAQRLLGTFQAAQGDLESARSAFAEALRLASARQDVPEQARILREMGRAALRAGDPGAAREHLEAALAHFESLRSAIAGDRLRLSHFALVRETYELSIEALMQLHAREPGAGFARQALAAAEQARARGLFDVLRQARVEVRAADPALLSTEQSLRWELNAKAGLRGRAAEGAVADLDRQIAALTAEYQLVEARLRARSPRYAGLRQPDLQLAALQREVLGRTTALVEYLLAEPRSFAWLVTSAGVEPFELPGRAALQELARRVHERLGDPAAAGRSALQTDLQELSRLLLAPALGRLDPAVHRLLVVADGALLYVPFAALPVSGPDGAPVPLIVRYEVLNVPSIAVLQEMRRGAASRRSAPADLAVLADPVLDAGDPRLPAATEPGGSLAAEDGLTRLAWSGREASAIAAAAGGRDVRLALGFAARRELVLAPELARYRILHFATHGVLDTEHPELSALVLSRLDEQGRPVEGFLRLQDVYGLHLQSDLVVLSGCQTALGRRMQGEGLIGLAYGFLFAGSSQVLASLWPVRDRATAELMDLFYRGLFQQRLRPAAALRAAQIEMWNRRATRDPFFWAAFVLQGDDLSPGG